MPTFPTLFLSHGSPDIALGEGAAVDFLRSIGYQLPKPTAILMISAHWQTKMPTVSTTLQPPTHHDFSGFPAALYRLNYPAPGAPTLAERVATLLDRVGIKCDRDPDRGLDHGAWIPLRLMHPQADIPTTQLSLQFDRDESYHWQLGAALAPLRDEGVLIIGSGSATHNLQAFSAIDAPPPLWVAKFDRWLAATIDRGDWNALRQYHHLAPYARENHPTAEHLLPLFVAAGAAGERAQGKQIHSSYMYGGLSMAAYEFDRV